MRLFPDYLPAEFGILLLTLALVAVIAPYASGHDYGKVKVPDFVPQTKRRLKWIGPVLLSLALLAHLPLFPKECSEPVYEEVTDRALCGITKQEYVATPASPKTCRNEAFGREGWKYTEETTGASGWMRGGQSQPDWCRRLIGSFISSRNISPQHDAAVVRSSENARWTGPVNRTREYNYSCTIRVSWEPIYAQGTSGELCGTTAAVMGVREVPATCKRKIGTRKVKCDA